MGWLWIVFFIVIIILGLGIVRVNKTNYRTGSGMFKNSEYNLDENCKYLVIGSDGVWD